MGMFSDIDYSLIVLQLEKAMANGVATLDSNTKVPKAQISLTASDVGAIASTGNEVLTSLNAASGTISSGLLPSYVDDVLNYTNLAGFPGTGETGKIYVDETTNKVYRWSGSVYVEISSSATAGEALKLTTPRTITTTGDASYSVSFDGSANVTSAITLATVNSNAGSFGSASSIPAITVNAKGQVTAVSTNSIGNELIALQSLSDTPGFLKKTGDGTYSIDINSYLSLAGGTITGDLVSTSATVSTSPTTGAIRGASLGITGAIFAGTVSANSYNLIPIGRGGGNVNTNTVTGVGALQFNTTGGRLSAFGAYALQSNTTGWYSCAFGVHALLDNTTGTGSSAFGFNAGRYTSDGATSLTITNNSSFFGMNTKGTQDATNENVFGYNATGNGSNTVTIGDSNITNTYLRGVISTNSTTTSTSTTTGAICAASLGITGAIFAGTVSANSYNLIPIGRGGGSLSTNTVVGMNAGYSNTTGNYNSFVGVDAGLSNTTGNQNSFVGVNAGYSNTTGIQNSFVGVNAGRFNTTGNQNSFVGVNAGYSNTTGNNNSFVGVDAGRYTSDGVTDLTISNNSCFFGMNTKGTQNATNENVFGFNATGNGSNTVTIGDSNITNNFFRGALSLNGTQVISTRRTGWIAPTGTPTRTTFTTSTVTLEGLAERVKALIDDLTTHGLIGA